MTPANASPLARDTAVIGLVGAAHGISHFFHLILAPLFPWLKPAFGLSYADLGLLMTAFFIVSGVGQAIAGFVVDRIGARAVLFFGVTMLGVAGLVLSQAQSYSMLMAGAMVAGLGNSVFHPADFVLLNHRVSPANLSHAFSVHGFLGSIGLVVAPVFLAGTASLLGWRAALFAAALIPFLLLGVLFWYRHLLASAGAEVVESHAPQQVADGGMLDFVRVPAVWLCFAFFVLSAMVMGAIQSFSPMALHELRNLSIGSATSAYTVFMLASAGGTLFGGFLASRAANHQRTIAFALAAAALFSIVLASPVGSAGVAFVLMAGIGFGCGAAGPSRDLMIRSAAPRHAVGRVYGLVYSGLDAGLSIAPLVFGALMDAGHPAWVFLGAGGLLLLAALTALATADTLPALKDVKRQESGRHRRPPARG